MTAPDQAHVTGQYASPGPVAPAARESWSRRNAGHLVAWASAILIGAVAVGVYKSDFSTMKDDVAALKRDRAEMQAGLGAIKLDIGLIKVRLESLSTVPSKMDEVQHTLSSTLSELRADVRNHERQIDDLSRRVHRRRGGSDP